MASRRRVPRLAALMVALAPASGTGRPAAAAAENPSDPVSAGSMAIEMDQLVVR